jgi:C-methyltransferase
MTEKKKSPATFIPPVFFMNIINGIQSLFYKASKTLVPAPVWMMNHIENFWIAKGLYTAIELNITEHINEGKNTLEKLAEATGTKPDPLFRLMRMLCAHDIYKLSKNGTYSLTSYSRVLLEGDGSIKYFLKSHLGKLHSELFTEMDYTMRTGINASQKLFNEDIFSHVEHTPEEQDLFIRGMSDGSELFAPVLLSSYKFSSFNYIIDIGGGHGSLLCNVLSKNKNPKATLFDSKHVIERASANIDSYGFKERIEIVVGDFFLKVPEGGDLYILKNILHDWDDEKCILILKNIQKVMPAGSKLLIIETIIKNDNNYSFGKMIDILMLLGTENGRERTINEFSSILNNSGFNIKKVIPTVAPFSLIECIKQS